MKKVLFLCTGNSCRSQMAEAIVNARLGDRWQAFSAGTKPAGFVHARALEALREIGIQHQGRSKQADEFRGVDFDLVVTVCDSAAEECPIWLGKGKRVHHSFPDPAKAETGKAADKPAEGAKPAEAMTGAARFRRVQEHVAQHGDAALVHGQGHVLRQHRGDQAWEVVSLVVGGDDYE